MLSKASYLARRQALFDKMCPNSLGLIFSNPPAHRNGDVYYPYRAHSHQLYLTGVNEEQVVCLFYKGEQTERFEIFHRQADPQHLRWEGRLLSESDALDVLGADESHPISAFDKRLMEYMVRVTRIYVDYQQAAAINKVQTALNQVSKQVRAGKQSPGELHDIQPLLSDLRQIKSAEEHSLMQRSADIAVSAHFALMDRLKPGVLENQLEGALLNCFAENGARFPAYHPIIAGGERACILHYHENDQVLNDGELLLVDAGCEYQYYASDISRTLPVNGRFSEPQAQIYDLVLSAQEAGIDVIKPGVRWSAIQETMVEVITSGLLSLGILKGDLKTLISEKAYKRFYMHSSGHWLGMDVHDVGTYTLDGESIPLATGMVLTVEPGIYIDRGLADVDPMYHGIGVRIEDDIYVSQDGHVNLTEKLMRQREEIEAYMAQR